MRQETKLQLECMAIGSLPHFSVAEAMDLVKENFEKVPFWPQLVKFNKKEDMIVQFSEGMPAFFVDSEDAKSYMTTDYDEFCDDFEKFYMDYEECVADINSDTLENYGISAENSSTFGAFLEIIKKNQPNFVKGQVVGPFTLATTLVDKDGRCAVYDETLREIIVKTLSLKALWQIREIKKVLPDVTPIIFIDEPTVSQLGTSAFITISHDEVVDMIKEIADLIQANGGLSAIHCCGKCDWSVPIGAGVDILNLDAYSYAQNLSLFHKDVDKFLQNGGKIAWGVVTTLDSAALDKLTLEKAVEIFDNAVKYLTKKGINEKLVIENSIITPSCGAGSLSVPLAEKAMRLTRAVSDSLKEKYIDC